MTVDTKQGSQHMEALEMANYIRLGRAVIKREIKAGTRSAASVVLNVPGTCQSMSIMELLCSQRRWGLTRSRKLLVRLTIRETRKLCDLTPRQRAVLAHSLEQGD